MSVWPRGKILGGTSRLNFMMYVRGDPKDFESWAKQGNNGWSYKDVLPFFKKSEKHNSNNKSSMIILLSLNFSITIFP